MMKTVRGETRRSLVCVHGETRTLRGLKGVKETGPKV